MADPIDLISRIKWISSIFKLIANISNDFWFICYQKKRVFFNFVPFNSFLTFNLVAYFLC